MSERTQLHPGTPIKIAILAMGGQGGGVLADWLVDMAEHAHWWAQTTSVPGVAQRTGATIYYVELLPESDVAAAGRQPALALMPTPGDVDLVVSAELMEAGRAMQRELVSPERTVFITSSHRSYAVGEKSAPGNGISDPNKVIEAGRECAKRFMCFDLQALADKAGSVISASLFGAIAGSGALPFTREDFEETIRRGGLGVENSLKAFANGFEAAHNAPEQAELLDLTRPMPEVPTSAKHASINKLLDSIRQDFPEVAQPMLVAGLRRTIDFQDVAYGRQYLATLKELNQLEAQHGGADKQWSLTVAAARYVAVAMAYDDVIRVADLKTRGERFARVQKEIGVKEGQLIYTTEYMHPQLDEVCGTMPAPLGKWILNSAGMRRVIEPFCRKGRFMQTGTLSGFLLLYSLSGMRRFRRSTLRHQIERKSLDAWLDLVRKTLPIDHDLAVEIVECRRLVKGYSDTHVRGSSKYLKLLDAAQHLSGKPEAAQKLRQLRDAALADAEGKQLDAMLQQDRLALA
ncbi:indolepyruvate oxidoreductase subunit beta family protein [Pusillimonas sp. CC-YST705]|uniref:Indolepyruvate oxidoreductase subunit beta family protein n=1 Tax=Mesopusillimonas faecipullorum TaxID=2755040 RepID=A0ABS8C9R1_9BURK|nr:indolepyruvate oxidoreductase subunit beta family protein [Mesopusillimonas faecipullorum]MCB5362760.1 indolepyruvate oxidoreductase subunit beta family protein [Mesopusillimonas faecipullorum]